MNVLLVNPAFPYTGQDKFPLGLGYLAAIAIQQGHAVTVVDENIGDEVPWAKLRQYDVVGFTAATPTFRRVQEMVGWMRGKSDFHGVVIAGGHHPTFCPEAVLRAGADIAVRGEGDVQFAEILKVLSSAPSTCGWEGVPGISFLGTSGDVQHNAAHPHLQDLAAVPFPAWAAFSYTKYDPISIITSRGCPYRCSYCGASAFWQHTVRFRPVPNVMAEVDALMALHPFPYVKFEDSVFTLNMSRTAELLTAIAERNYPFHWACETRADALDAELLALMANAKCKVIMLGVESGAQGILNLNERKMQVGQIATTCALIKQHHIGLRVSVIFGLPGETEATVEETLALLRACRPNVTFLNLATAYPGCPLAAAGHRTANFKDNWVRSFGGHGTGGRIILPDGMPPEKYQSLADYLRREIYTLNKIHWEKEVKGVHKYDDS